MRQIAIVLGFALAGLAVWHSRSSDVEDLLTLVAPEWPGREASPADRRTGPGNGQESASFSVGADRRHPPSPLAQEYSRHDVPTAQRSRSGSRSAPARTAPQGQSARDLRAMDDPFSASPKPSREDNDDREPNRLPITGWVHDQAGEPVGNATVSATARRVAGDGGTGADGTRSALTGPDGYFAFENLLEGEYLLRVEATEAYEAARTIVRTGVTSIVLTVKGDKGAPATLSGQVVDGQGLPIAAVRVSPTDEAVAAMTDGEGKYSLVLTVDDRPRTRTIRFTKAGYRPGSSGVSQAKLRETGNGRLDAQLTAVGGGAPVSGVVMADGGNPVTQARVQLTSSALGRSYWVQTGADGSFFIDDVEAGGGYRLRVRPRKDYGDYVEDGLQVPQAGLDVPIVLEPLGTGGLRGRMIDAFGAPVPRFTLWMRSSAPGAQRKRTVTGDESGAFQIADVPAGVVVFNSRGTPEFSIGGIQLEAGETTEADLVIDWGDEQLAGVVEDSRGSLIAGAKVRLTWSNNTGGLISRSRRQTVTDSDGYFLFSELGPGPHTIQVTAPGYRPARRESPPSGTGGDVLIKLLEEAS